MTEAAFFGSPTPCSPPCLLSLESRGRGKRWECGGGRFDTRLPHTHKHRVIFPFVRLGFSSAFFRARIVGFVSVGMGGVEVPASTQDRWMDRSSRRHRSHIPREHRKPRVDGRDRNQGKGSCTHAPGRCGGREPARDMDAIPPHARGGWPSVPRKARPSGEVRGQRSTTKGEKNKEGWRYPARIPALPLETPGNDARERSITASLIALRPRSPSQNRSPRRRTNRFPSTVPTHPSWARRPGL